MAYKCFKHFFLFISGNILKTVLIFFLDLTETRLRKEGQDGKGRPRPVSRPEQENKEKKRQKRWRKDEERKKKKFFLQFKI